MSARSRRVLVAGFVAYVVATAVHVGWILAHEPFAFDAWNLAVDTRSEPFTAGGFFDYWWNQYTHSNPRIGQPLTYLSYKLEYFAVIATPLAHLSIAIATVILGLGRRPRGRDLALVAIAIGFSWFAFPEIGRNMFNRAYGANYVYCAALQLWFLVPLRLAGTRTVSTRACVAYAIAGAVAGACNEHTGPALLATLLAYAWWQRRAGEKPRLAWAGLLGFAIGFAAIVLAPGQGERYDGLVTKTSLPMRMIQRGVIGALDILHDYLVFAAPLFALVLVLLAIAIWRGRSRESLVPALRLVAIATAIGIVISATLFVSPKLGSRFYLLGNALLLAATIAMIDCVVERPRRLALLVAIGVFASSYAAFRTVPLYGRVAGQGDERMAMLAAAKPGTSIVADAFDQVEESWWYIGDDFRDPRKREIVARYLGLDQVSFRAFDINAPLGATAIRVVGRYTVEGEATSREDTVLDLEGRGLDVAGIVTAAQTRIATVRATTALSRYELVVESIGAAPPLPRPRVVVARWLNGTFVAHAGKLGRPGATTAREVTVPASANALELYAVQLGGEYRALDSTRRFTPWRTGLYWALACAPDECWVVAAGRLHAF